MWIHGKGLTFVECIIAGVIIAIFLVVVLPVLSRNEIVFRQDNLHTNLSKFHQQVGGYHRDYGEGERGFLGAKTSKNALTSAGNTQASGYSHQALPEYPFAAVLPEKEIGIIP